MTGDGSYCIELAIVAGQLSQTGLIARGQPLGLQSDLAKIEINATKLAARGFVGGADPTWPARTPRFRHAP